MKKVVAKVNLYENGAFIKKGSEFFVNSKRLKALGKLVEVVNEGKKEEDKKVDGKALSDGIKNKMVEETKNK